MMSVPGFHESHPPTATIPVSAAAPASAPVNAPPSYTYAHPPATTAHDGHSPSAHNGLAPAPRLGQAPVYAPAATIQPSPDARGLVHAVPHQHQQQQPQHQPRPHQHSHTSQISPHQHQHVVTPPMQYSSVGGHGTSASPPGAQALTPAASSVSSPQKKNTRIPRACDLCSQRKVKVSSPPPPPLCA